MNDERQPGQFYLQRAEALHDLRRWREAIHELHQCLRAAPENYRALCLLAGCHYWLGESKAALEFAAKAAALDPANEWAYRLQSLVHLHLKQKEKALAAAREAVRVQPESAWALAHLAHVLIEIRRFDQAREVAFKLRELAPDDERAPRSLGEIEMNERNWIAAESFFRRALEIEPNNSRAINNLGWVLLNLARRARERTKREKLRLAAVECFENAVRLDPAFRLAKGNLAAARSRRFVRLGDWSFSRFGAFGLLIFPPWLALIFASPLISFYLSPTKTSPILFFINQIFLLVVAGYVGAWIVEWIISEQAHRDRFEWRDKPPLGKIFVFAIPAAALLIIALIDRHKFWRELTALTAIAFVYLWANTIWQTIKYRRTRKRFV